jgi:hypothetical protein
MGLLLAFMFIGNMLGALILLPALGQLLLRGPDRTATVAAPSASPAELIAFHAVP